MTVNFRRAERRAAHLNIGVNGKSNVGRFTIFFQTANDRVQTRFLSAARVL